MTNHYFSNDLVDLHYYRFGTGPKNMFCFHGYGMHGRQFTLLKEALGEQYTFYGFDLLFHQKTVLRDQSANALKKGIPKSQLAALFKEFCEMAGIDRFSILAYSMGSYYATSLVEEMPEHIEELFIAAPASLKTGKIITFLGMNRLGNKVFEWLALSDTAMADFLSVLKKTKIINKKAYDILYKEVSSPELRFSFYACVSYMRFLTINQEKFIAKLNYHQIKSVFIFGKQDSNYPPSIGRTIVPKINLARQLMIDENHDMINRKFTSVLSGLLHDH